MRMIEDLFYGNICPCEKHPTRGSEYSQLLDKAVNKHPPAKRVDVYCK